VRNATMRGGLRGVFVTGAAPRIDVSLSDVQISGVGTGINPHTGFISLVNSVITKSQHFGVLTNGGTTAIERSLLTGNGTAVQAQLGSTINLSDRGIQNNTVGIGCGQGTLNSAGNNRIAGNPGGSCAPTGAMTLQ
jgi:hypothetical protein